MAEAVAVGVGEEVVVGVGDAVAELLGVGEAVAECAGVGVVAIVKTHADTTSRATEVTRVAVFDVMLLR